MLRGEANFVNRCFDAFLGNARILVKQDGRAALPQGLHVIVGCGQPGRRFLLEKLPWMTDLPYPLNELTWTKFLTQHRPNDDSEPPCKLVTSRYSLKPERMIELYSTEQDRQELVRCAERLATLPESYFLEFIQTYANKRAKHA
jgi:hypothetical protein